LHGGTDALGFLFFYELFTDTLRLRILSDDKPFQLASLLVRCLPTSDWQPQSELMSVLRAVSEDYALSNRLPKYKDDRRFKLLGSVDVNKKLLKAVAEQFSREQKIVVAEKKWVAFEAPATLCVAPAQELQSKLRVWTMPRATNLSCRQRSLKPLKVSAKSTVSATVATSNGGGGSEEASLEVPSADLEAHAGCLLGSVVANPGGLGGGGSFAEHTSRSSRGEPPVPTSLPFDVSKHPAANSHVAKDMVNMHERFKIGCVFWGVCVFFCCVD
jgi:hypothetical protein